MRCGHGLEGKKVLVVEDEFLVAMDVEAELETLGVAVTCVGTLRQAFGQAENGEFDAVVLDLNLHGEESYPVADLLQRREVPFLFHTGQGEPSSLRKRYPGVAVCSKPCDGTRLADTVRQLIETRRPLN